MNAEHERALALRDLTGVAVDVPWKTYGLFPQLLFFILTCIATLAFYMLFSRSGLLTGIVALALAEWAILRWRWWRTGVEAALWGGGVLALVTALPESGKPEALLVLAAGAAAAGVRLRHPLFGALAAGFVMQYFEKKWDLGVLVAMIMASAAIALLCRTWRRPSTEWLFIAVALALPVAGWGEADEKWRTTTIALYAAFGLFALTAAIARRHHAFFCAAAIGFAVAAVEFARGLTLRLEAKLAIGGAFLLALSLLVSRLLRDRTRGFVTTREQLTKADELLEIAGTLAVAPPTVRNDPGSGPHGGGGGFGGAGASGTY